MADTLFLTGRLAEPALRSIASELGIDHQITVMNISVAALMTTRWIAKRLEVPPGVDNIVIPGLCEGDVDTLQQATGVPVRKGPADLRALPEWYGREAVRAELGPRDVRGSRGQARTVDARNRRLWVQERRAVRQRDFDGGRPFVREAASGGLKRNASR